MIKRNDIRCEHCGDSKNRSRYYVFSATEQDVTEAEAIKYAKAKDAGRAAATPAASALWDVTAQAWLVTLTPRKKAQAIEATQGRLL
jgi:hypothetical protein